MDVSYRLDPIAKQFKYLDTVSRETRAWLDELRMSLRLVIGGEPIVETAHLDDSMLNASMIVSPP